MSHGPTINKASTDEERTVRVCVTSENKSRGPLRGRYMTVMGEIHSKMQSDKKTLLESMDTETLEKTTTGDGWRA